jgi:hypothetical protein
MLAVIQFRTFFFFRLLSKNVKIEVHKFTKLPVVLYGRETWNFDSKEGHRLRELKNRAIG